MARTVHAVLTDPDQVGERDIEIRHTDSFLRVRAGRKPSRLHDRADRERSHEGS